jgi:hypothetical protein
MKTKRHKNMTPNSSYLISLTDRMSENDETVKYMTIGSNQDIHVPDTYAKFPNDLGIPHHTFDGYGHFSIVSVERIWKLIADKI